MCAVVEVCTATARAMGFPINFKFRDGAGKVFRENTVQAAQDIGRQLSNIYILSSLFLPSLKMKEKPKMAEEFALIPHSNISKHSHK